MKMNSPPRLALSLWAIRQLLRERPLELFEDLRELADETGHFDRIEVAGFDKWSPGAFAVNLVQNNRFSVCGLHAPQLQKDTNPTQLRDWALRYLPKFNANTLVVQTSSRQISPAFGRAAADVAELLSQVEKLAELLAAENELWRVQYHCYPHDFAQFGDKSIVDGITDMASRRSNIGLELDTFWLRVAKITPAAIAKLPVASVHLNERSDTGQSYALGTDWERCGAYIQALKQSGRDIDWILENDPETRFLRSWDPIGNARRCAETWSLIWEGTATSKSQLTERIALFGEQHVDPVSGASPMIFDSTETLAEEVAVLTRPLFYGQKQEHTIERLKLDAAEAKEYIAKRGNDSEFAYEEILLNHFWPTLEVRPKMILVVGGGGSGKTTFIRFFLGYYLRYREQLHHRSCDESKGILASYSRHVFLYCDLRRAIEPIEDSLYASIRDSLFQMRRDSQLPDAIFQQAPADPKGFVKHVLSRLTNAFDEARRRCWYVTLILDNSDQMDDDTQLSLHKLIQSWLPEDVENDWPPSEADREQTRFWRVILPIRPETYDNISPALTFRNKVQIVLPQVHVSAFAEMHSSRLKKAITEGEKHYLEDSIGAHDPTRAEFVLVKPEKLADEHSELYMEAHRCTTTERSINSEPSFIFRNLCGDSCRRRESLTARVAFSNPFRYRHNEWKNNRSWVVKITDFFFISGLILGKENSFRNSANDIPIVNLFDLGELPGTAHSVMIGVIAVELLRVGKFWDDAKRILLNMGFGPADVDRCEQWLKGKEFIRGMGRRRNDIDRNLAMAHTMLLRQGAYLEIMASSCAERWGTPTEAPVTDPTDKEQLVHRIRGAVWLISRIDEFEKEVRSVPDAARSRDFNIAWREISTVHFAAEIAKEYHSAINNLDDKRQTKKFLEDLGFKQLLETLRHLGG